MQSRHRMLAFCLCQTSLWEAGDVRHPTAATCPTGSFTRPHTLERNESRYEVKNGIVTEVTADCRFGVQPYKKVQACERADIMNIGGFSDSVFNVISGFMADNNQRFVAEVEAIEL